MVAAWRVVRGLTAEFTARWLAGLEAGRGWVDRRSTMIALAGVLGRAPLMLAGQPFPPTNPPQG